MSHPIRSSDARKETSVTSEVSDLRGCAAMHQHRGRRPVIAVCRDDAEQWDAWRRTVEGFGGALVIEVDAGPVSAHIGRPRVAVTDRYLEILVTTRDIDPQEAISWLAYAELSNGSCPQAADERGGEQWSDSRAR